MAKTKKEIPPTKKQIQEWKKKAEMWDALDKEIGGFYVDENGNELEDNEGGGLTSIGEVAARSFGWL
jgi:hypothetical protein